MKPRHEILSHARSFIDKPDKWTKHTNARETNNYPVNPESTNAVCFCAYGAIRLAVWWNVDNTLGFERSYTTRQLSDYVFREANDKSVRDGDFISDEYSCLEDWNDDR